MLLNKKISKVQAAKQNKVAFAALPSSEVAVAKKVKPQDSFKILADSAATRDGQYKAASRNGMTSKNEALAAKAKVAAFAELPFHNVLAQAKIEAAEANAAAFAELPFHHVIAQAKTKMTSVEDILSESAKVRDGYSMGPSIGSKIVKLVSYVASGVGYVASSVGATLSAAIGVVRGLGTKLVSAFNAPSRKIADAKANKEAFTNLPSSDVVPPARIKNKFKDKYLDDSVKVRNEISKQPLKSDIKPVVPKTTAKENAEAFKELPIEIISEAKPARSAAYKEMVASNNAALRKSLAKKLQKDIKGNGKSGIKTYVLPVIPSYEKLSLDA